ncbi:MAG: hypothetical protein J0H60_13015 [Rhizobiales bacterium]|nr:hypothetical protein [Hyphomicrobiales bacterium]
MSPRPAKKADVAETSRLIRSEIKTARNARFLQRLPVFKAEPDVPEELQEMLARLEQAERARPA